jgi:hypothetical protein
MPRWSNRPLTVFHGTDSGSLAAYGPLAPNRPLVGFAVSVGRGGHNTDFGQGFYLTTYDHQATQWANGKVRRHLRATGTRLQAVVLSFSIDRDLLAAADTLAFVAATPDYWDLVHDCRLGFRSHRRPGTKRTYDVVYGPVSLWRQELIIYDSDQMSIHDQSLADTLPTPLVHQLATAAGGFL